MAATATAVVRFGALAITLAERLKVRLLADHKIEQLTVSRVMLWTGWSDLVGKYQGIRPLKTVRLWLLLLSHI